MESKFLANLETLTMNQKMSFARGKLQTIGDLLTKSPAEAAKKCKIPLREMEDLIDSVCKEVAPQPLLLSDVAHLGDEKFTTGDTHLDQVLGGGFRTGMLWDVSGENNAGKTQLALQISLTVQLPKHLGGLSGAACYVSTRGDIPTGRIAEIRDKHPLLSPELCGIPDIHTVKAPFYVGLEVVLLDSVPAIADKRAADPNAKPVKLLVIDTVTDIFDPLRDERYEGDKILRARHLRRTSLLLHQLITKYQLAVVVLGATGNTFSRRDGGDRAPGELRYSDQSRWFCRSHTLAGEDAHEAVLGHVWPNQLNARIMMTRTIRTRPRFVVHPREQDGRASKRRKLEGDKADDAAAADESVPFRRISVIFSSVAPPAFCDYVIFDEGVVGIAPEEQPPSTFIYPRTPTASPPDSSAVLTSHGYSQPQPSAGPSTSGRGGSQLRYQQSLSYASGSTHSLRATAASVPPVSQSVVPSSQPDLDEDWDMYWKDSQGDEHLYASVEDHIEGVVPARAMAAADAVEAAEVGPPMENDVDSDYYWDDGTDDGLYADI